jgi:hypothetical protein|tara:strand:+ start:256 stop:429 length:174 start_codon:yes stop_codon:yes gene_type:complete
MSKETEQLMDVLQTRKLFIEVFLASPEAELNLYDNVKEAYEALAEVNVEIETLKNQI